MVNSTFNMINSTFYMVNVLFFISVSVEGRLQISDCRPGVKCRPRVKCRLKTVDQGLNVDSVQKQPAYPDKLQE